MVNDEYAYHYWCSAFEKMSGGKFKNIFDKWFKQDARLGHGMVEPNKVENIYELGSNEHFQICLLRSFRNLIQASSDGDFGRRDR